MEFRAFDDKRALTDKNGIVWSFAPGTHKKMEHISAILKNGEPFQAKGCGPIYRGSFMWLDHGQLYFVVVANTDIKKQKIINDKTHCAIYEPGTLTQPPVERGGASWKPDWECYMYNWNGCPELARDKFLMFAGRVGFGGINEL